MGLGGRVAPFACGLASFAPPFIHDRLRDARRNQADRDLVARAQIQRVLDQ